MNKRIAKFLADNQPETPCLVVDLDVVAQAYKLLRRYMPLAKIFYAVKANPAPEVVALLRDLESNFDVASRNEIDLCLERGVAPERISFGNTIKKERDIAYAFGCGVTLYAFDSQAELEKLARAENSGQSRHTASSPAAASAISPRARPTPSAEAAREPTMSQRSDRPSVSAATRWVSS